MKIISIDQVEKTKVQMEGATGAWKQLPLGSNNSTDKVFRMICGVPKEFE